MKGTNTDNHQQHGGQSGAPQQPHSVEISDGHRKLTLSTLFSVHDYGEDAVPVR